MPTEFLIACAKYGIPSLLFFTTTVIFLLLFRTPIHRKIEEIKSAGKAGIEFTPPPQQTEVSSTEAPAAPQDVVSFMARTHTPTILQIEENVRKDLERSAPTNQAERERILLRAVAAAQAASEFERIASLLWRSQFLALQILNTRPNGMHPDEIRPYYDDAAEKTLMHIPITASSSGAISLY